MLRIAHEGVIMQRIVLSLFMLLGVAFSAPKVVFKNACVPLEEFSQSQKTVLLRAYLAGEREGFGLLLAAIAWKESCAGVYKVNFQDPSAGNFHAYIPGVIRKYPELKQNGFTQNMVGAMLVEDDTFAEEIAIAELKFWQKEHKGNQKNIIKSYNKGYSWTKSANANLQAEKYYQDIIWRIGKLEYYFQHSAPQSSQKPKEESPKPLQIYQVGNEFAMPYHPKSTIFKEFELLN